MIDPMLLIHQPSRLRAMAALVALPEGRSIDFVSLNKLVKLTDGNLSSHLSTLEEVDYVCIQKTFEGKRPKTRIHVTRKGRDAFAKYVEELERILKGAPD